MFLVCVRYITEHGSRGNGQSKQLFSVSTIHSNHNLSLPRQCSVDLSMICQSRFSQQVHTLSLDRLELQIGIGMQCKAPHIQHNQSGLSLGFWGHSDGWTNFNRTIFSHVHGEVRVNNLRHYNVALCFCQSWVVSRIFKYVSMY